jgi:hypothetical protein
MASFVLFAVFQFCADAFYFGIIPFRIFQKEIQENGTHRNLLLDKFLPLLVNCNGHVFLLRHGIVAIIRDHLTTHEHLDTNFLAGLPIIQGFVLVKIRIQMRLVCDHFQYFVAQTTQACVDFPRVASACWLICLITNMKPKRLISILGAVREISMSSVFMVFSIVCLDIHKKWVHAEWGGTVRAVEEKGWVGVAALATFVAPMLNAVCNGVWNGNQLPAAGG